MRKVKLQRLLNWFERQSPFWQVLLMVVVDQVIVFTISGLAILLFGEEVLGGPNPLEEESGVVIFIGAVLIAPWLETLIFQFGIIELFLLIFKKFDRVRLVAVLVSGAVFGIAHNYDSFYMVFASCLGFYLGLIYLFFRTESRKRAYQMVAMVHMFRNLLVFLFIVLDR